MIANPLGCAVVREPGDIWRVNRSDVVARQVQPEGVNGERVSMVFTFADFNDVVTTIATQADIKLEFDPGLHTEKREVMARLSNVDWLQALEAVVKSCGLELSRRPDNTFVVKKASAKP